MGRNGSICNACIHLATHMDGEKHFYPNGRTIGQVPLEEWVGPGVIADISKLVSNSVCIHPCNDLKVLLISMKAISSSSRPAGHKYGWNQQGFR